MVGLDSAAGEPSSEVAVDAAEVGAAAAVADVAVWPHQVLRCAFDAEASERLPVDIVQCAGRRLAGKSVHGEEAAVPVLQGEVVCVPVVGWSAEWEVKGRRGDGVL